MPLLHLNGSVSASDLRRVRVWELAPFSYTFYERVLQLPD